MGQIIFSLGLSSVTIPSNSNQFNQEECNFYFKSLKSASGIDCVRETFNASSGTGSYLLTINSFPILPQENNFFHHNGNPDIANFKCNVSRVDNEFAMSPYCSVDDVVNDDLPGTF